MIAEQDNITRPQTSSITLTRREVEIIVIDCMGWEMEDVSAFWTLARRAQRRPDFLESKRRERTLWLQDIFSQKDVS